MKNNKLKNNLTRISAALLAGLLIAQPAHVAVLTASAVETEADRAGAEKEGQGAFSENADNVDNLESLHDAVAGKIATASNAEKPSEQAGGTEAPLPELDKKLLAAPLLKAEEERWLEWENSAAASDKEAFHISKIQVSAEEELPEGARLSVQIFPDQQMNSVNAMITEQLADNKTKKAATKCMFDIVLEDGQRLPLDGLYHIRVRVFMDHMPEPEKDLMYEYSANIGNPYSPDIRELSYEIVSDEQGNDGQDNYIEFQIDLVSASDRTAQTAVCLAQLVDRDIVYSDVSMRIVEVDGEEIDPVSAYPADNGQTVVLEAATVTPAEDFYMFIGGLLVDPTITATDEDGTVLQAERLTRDADQGYPGPIYHFTGGTADKELKLRIEGENTIDNMTAGAAAYEGIWFVPEDEVNTAFHQSYYSGIAMTEEQKKGALCFLGKPLLAMVLEDQNGTPMIPAINLGMSNFYFMMTGNKAQWKQIIRTANYQDKNKYLDKIKGQIQSFVLTDQDDKDNPTVNSVEEGLCFEFAKTGTYTLSAIQNPDYQGTDQVSLESVTIELEYDPQSDLKPIFPQIDQRQGKVSVGDLGVNNGYRFRINGQLIPLMRLQEIRDLYTKAIGGSSTYDLEAMDLKIPVQQPASATAVGTAVMEMPGVQPVSGPSVPVEMKIVTEEGLRPAVAASYNDEIKWQSTVDVSETLKDDWIIELRYDTSNQDYISGNGVMPLFEYDPTVSVRLILADDANTEIPLAQGTDYSLEMPDGYFRVDQKVDGQRIDPRSYNGKWPQVWYEIEPRYSAMKPYYLHPFFQKQVIRIPYLTDEVKAGIREHFSSASEEIAEGEEFRGVSKIVVESTGRLAESAYTGGYGNPARVLAFGRMYPKPDPTIPIVKSPRLLKAPKALDPNEKADQAADYYLIPEDMNPENGYINIGFDATAVYTSSVTVHKVDENKKDLKGAAFAVLTEEEAAADARVIKGKSSHLVLSHFIPGFSLLRPVPDSEDEVSRRNLTAIGEPALNEADPAGDATGKDAYLTYTGLNEGSYIIRETKAPEGYQAGDDIRLKLTADLPEEVITGYEFCRWMAQVNGKDIPIVEQLANDYPDVDEDAYQMFSCNSSQIVLRVANLPKEPETEPSSEPQTEPTESSSESVPETEPTEPSSESVPETEPTEPSSESVPETEPTESSSESEPETEPTESSSESVPETEPTEPNSEPETKPTEPSSEPETKPTEPSSEPETSPAEPSSEPETKPSESGFEPETRYPEPSSDAETKPTETKRATPSNSGGGNPPGGSNHWPGIPSWNTPPTEGENTPPQGVLGESRLPEAIGKVLGDYREPTGVLGASRTGDDSPVALAEAAMLLSALGTVIAVGNRRRQKTRE